MKYGIVLEVLIKWMCRQEWIWNSARNKVLISKMQTDASTIQNNAIVTKYKAWVKWKMLRLRIHNWWMHKHLCIYNNIHMHTIYRKAQLVCRSKRGSLLSFMDTIYCKIIRMSTYYIYFSNENIFYNRITWSSFKSKNQHVAIWCNMLENLSVSTNDIEIISMFVYRD